MQKVLIVDDSIVIRILLKQALSERFPNLIIEEAANGKEALEKVAILRPDAVFMDIELPDNDGLKITRIIKEHNPNVSVIILTSYDQPEYREIALQAGADHFFTKSSLNSLIGIISQLSDSNSQETPGSTSSPGSSVS